MSSIAITRTQHRILPEARRVLAKPYSPGEESVAGGPSRAAHLVERVLAIPEAEVGALLDGILASYSRRHRDFSQILDRHFQLIATSCPSRDVRLAEAPLTDGRVFHARILGRGRGALQSLDRSCSRPERPRCWRATIRDEPSRRGRRSPVIDRVPIRAPRSGRRLTFDPPGSHLVAGLRAPPNHYDKRLFSLKLAELGAGNELAWSVLERLRDQFTLADLESPWSELEKHGPPHAISFETVKIIRVLASSNYVTAFPPSRPCPNA